MELGISEQIFEQIKKSRKIIILLPEVLTADSVASGLALRLFLQKLQKDVEVVSSGQVPAALDFLPGSTELKATIAAGKSLVITLNTTAKKLEEISYETTADKVQIFLKPQGQQFELSDLSFGQEKFPVDLIMVLAAKSMEDLGQIYEQNADLFFETPKINIDNRADNEYFGSVNLVDLTATSTAEILADLFQKYEQQLIDQDIATCLLAGIIEKTSSFQHVQTTPKTFLKASELVALGGRQQEVVKNIYKTKSLPLLKLWGRALARLKVMEPQTVVYSTLHLTDFERAEASEAEIIPTLKEFVENISGYKIVGLIYEPKEGGSAILAAVHEQVPADRLLGLLGEKGSLLNLSFGNYKLLQISSSQASVEQMEARFTETVASL